ncbi:alpha-mannosidase [Photobacterium aphoticum]|uniref:Alpha-mannosidase n=1 Tax=Photobacterium aphoticum TaxID=754436 RepID=A0A090R098_9GAMM|nr:alpha-mannosidase [Photobacterium aphoticum]
MLAKGVKEYEMRADNQLALTLFRGVGWLGKPDLQRRPGIASGQQFKYIPTPDSQLRGPIEAEFAVVIDRQFDAAAIQRAWQQYAVDVLPYQAQSLNQFTNTLKYFVMHPLTHKVADHAQGITLQSDELVLSALKPTMSGDGVLIRVYNPSSQTVASAGELHLPMAFREMVEVNLREHPVATPVVCLGTVPLVHFKPKQIRSFIVR